MTTFVYHRTPSASRSCLRWAAAFLSLAVLPVAASAQAPARDVTGTWIFTVVTENGTGTPTVVLEQRGEEVTGSYSSDRMGTRRLQGTLRGDTLSFRLAPSPEGGDVILHFIGILEGHDAISGTVDFGGLGGATFSARRRPPPGAERPDSPRSGGPS